MSSKIRILIKIYYIRSTFSFIRQITSRMKTIKSRLILIITFVFQSLLKDVVESKKILSEDLLNPQPTLAVPFPALTNPLPTNIFPNKLTNKPNSILRNPPFCSFASSLWFH